MAQWQNPDRENKVLIKMIKDGREESYLHEPSEITPDLLTRYATDAGYINFRVFIKDNEGQTKEIESPEEFEQLQPGNEINIGPYDKLGN
jgi:hypothetical protein